MSPRSGGLSRRSRLALAVLPALAATLAAGVAFGLQGRSAAPADVADAADTAGSGPVVRLDETGLRTGLAPPIELPSLVEGAAPVSLARLRGTPTVVNFFASTCVPCRTELPLLEQASQRWAGRVRFVGVDHLDRAEPARDLVARAGVTFPVGYDPDGDTALRYEVPALPATFFVDADGRITGRVLGALTPSALSERLASLAAQPSTDQPVPPS